MFTSRRTKIQKHQKSTLARHALQAEEDAKAKLRLMLNMAVEDGDELGVGLEDQVKRGVLTRIPKTPLTILLLLTLLLNTLSNRTSLLPLPFLSATGSSITSALSMTTGMLMGYRSSSALGRWGKGKAVWRETIRGEVRDALRMISLIHPLPSLSLSSSTSSTSSLTPSRPQPHPLSTSVRPAEGNEPIEVDQMSARQLKEELVRQRAGELCALLVSFTFALHHHLNKSRAMINLVPLCDLLPTGYLTSVKRTENRVRFAGESETDSEPSSEADSSDDMSDQRTGIRNGDAMQMKKLAGRTGLRNRKGSRSAAQSKQLKTRERELQHQQLNIAPSSPSFGKDYNDYLVNHVPDERNGTGKSPSSESVTTRSSLSASLPSNLPLDLLRLMESYTNSLHLTYKMETAPETPLPPAARLGWELFQSEKMHKTIRSLSSALGQAELLSEDPPPLSLSIHLNHLVMLYLVALGIQSMPTLGKWSLLVVGLAGWALLGMEGLCREIGAVFGSSENHLPTRLYAMEILNEALDTSPLFLEYYRSRMASRLQGTKVRKGDMTREREEATLRSLDKRRSDLWTPDFGMK